MGRYKRTRYGIFSKRVQTFKYIFGLIYFDNEWDRCAVHYSVVVMDVRDEKVIYEREYKRYDNAWKHFRELVYNNL